MPHHALAFPGLDFSFNLSSTLLLQYSVSFASQQTLLGLTWPSFAECLCCVIKLAPATKSPDACPISPSMIRLHPPEVIISCCTRKHADLPRRGYKPPQNECMNDRYMWHT